MLQVSLCSTSFTLHCTWLVLFLEPQSPSKLVHLHAWQRCLTAMVNAGCGLVYQCYSSTFLRHLIHSQIRWDSTRRLKQLSRSRALDVGEWYTQTHSWSSSTTSRKLLYESSVQYERRFRYLSKTGATSVTAHVPQVMHNAYCSLCWLLAELNNKPWWIWNNYCSLHCQQCQTANPPLHSRSFSRVNVKPGRHWHS